MKFGTFSAASMHRDDFFIFMVMLAKYRRHHLAGK
jgi:hypothetical protein